MKNNYRPDTVEFLLDSYREQLDTLQHQVRTYRRSYRNLLPRIQKLEWLEDALFKVEALAYENNAVGIAFTQHLLADEDIPLGEAVRYLRACKRALSKCQEDLVDGGEQLPEVYENLIGTVELGSPDPVEEEEPEHDPKEMARLVGHNPNIITQAIAFIATLLHTVLRRLK